MYLTQIPGASPQLGNANMEYQIQTTLSLYVSTCSCHIFVGPRHSHFLRLAVHVALNQNKAVI